MGNALKFLIAIGLVLSLAGNAVVTWTSLKSTEGGALTACVGDGTTDDTACIQAHIYYAYNHGVAAVYCPSGNYKTSSTLYVDPPGDMEPFTFQGYISAGTGLSTAGTTLTVTTGPTAPWALSTSGEGTQLTAVSAGSLTASTLVTAGSGTSWTVNNSQLTSGAPNPVTFTAANFANPQKFGWSLGFFGDPHADAGLGPFSGTTDAGCLIQPTSNSYIGLVMGPGTGDVLENVAITSQFSDGSRNQQPAGTLGTANFGAGVIIAGGGGGAHITHLKHVSVRNYNTGIITEGNNNTQLADSDTFDNIVMDNVGTGIKIYGTQSDVCSIINPTITNYDVAIDNTVSKSCNIMGGNLSIEGAAIAFNNYSWSAATTYAGCTGAGFTFCVSYSINNDDGNLEASGRYNYFLAQTADYGIVPMDFISYTVTTSSTGTLVLGVDKAWLADNYPGGGQIGAGQPSGATLQADLQNAVYVYANEVPITFAGPGLEAYSPFWENTLCTQLMDTYRNWTGSASNAIINPDFSGDLNYVDGNVLTQTAWAQALCAAVVPVVQAAYPGAGGGLRLIGGDWGVATGNGSISTQFAAPLVIQVDQNTHISGKHLGFGPRFNLTIGNLATNSRGFGMQPQYFGNTPLYQFAVSPRGFGEWDANYFLPQGAGPGIGTTANNIFAGANGSNPETLFSLGEISAPFCGFAPCVWATPNMPSDLYAALSGSTLGVSNDLGSYPMIDCRVAFSAISYNSGSQSNNLRSPNCPGSSYGQNLTGANTNTNATDWVGTGWIGNGAGTGAGADLHVVSTLGGAISAMSDSSGTVTATTSSTLPVTSAVFAVTISGSPGNAYNGTFNATVASATTFTFALSGSPAACSSACGNWAAAGALQLGDEITGSGIPAGTVLVQPRYDVCSTCYLIGPNDTSGNLPSLSVGSSGSPITITAPTGAWEYVAGSTALYLDSSFLNWMYPGLGIWLDNGNGQQPYVVTGVYPRMGYVTVVGAIQPAANALLDTAALPSGGLATGAVTANPHTGTTIYQAPYEFTDKPRYVQSQTNATGYFGSSQNGTTTSLPNTVGSGHCIVGVATWPNSGGTTTLTSVKDDQGNSYTLLDTATLSSYSAETFWKCGITNNPRSFTSLTSASSANAFVIEADEFSGPTGLDGHAMVTTGSAGITTTQNGDFVWAFGYEPTGQSPAAGFTITHRIVDGGGVNGTIGEWQKQTSAGAINTGLTGINGIVALH